MGSLTESQKELICEVTQRLASVPGVSAVVLGGSHARGRATAASDIDLGLLYSDSRPFSIQELAELTKELDDSGHPVVSELYGWGRWVNGGAWLTIKGQRVDLLYRSLERIDRVISDCENGVYEVDYAQQPPFGFFSGTYCGEVAVCRPLHDPTGVVEELKSRTDVYPETLRNNLIQDYMWSSEFGLKAFAVKYAYRADLFGTASCLTRVINQLIMSLFALNRRYLINDKTAIAEVDEFEMRPAGFGNRVNGILSNLGPDSVTLRQSIGQAEQIWCDTADLAKDLYEPRYKL